MPRRVGGVSAGDAFSRKTEKEAHPLEEGAAGSCRVCHPGAHAQLVDQWFLKTGTARNKLKGGKPQVGSVLATGPRATSSAQPWRPSQLLKLPPLLPLSHPFFPRQPPFIPRPLPQQGSQCCTSTQVKHCLLAGPPP